MGRRLAVMVSAAALIVGCATTDEQDAPPERIKPSVEYEDSTAKTPTYKCQPGYVLRCETKRVGRIRFSSIGKDNIESCSCEYNVVPRQSPLPGIY